MLPRSVRLIVTAGAIAGSACGGAGCDRPDPSEAVAPESAAMPATVDDPLVAEVLSNIVGQPVGDHRIADFGLPAPFLHRIADRVIRESYQDSFHVVFADRPVDAPPQAADTGRRAGPDPARASIVRAALTPEITGRRRAMPEAHPARRGFVAPILDDAALIETAAVPPNAVPALPQATALVGRRLAGDGLLATTVRAIDRLGPSAFVDRPEALREHLRATGLPVDLLRYFDLPGAHPLAALCGRLAGGASVEALIAEVAAARFAFVATHRGFHVSTESGENEIGLVRAQLTRDSYWRGPGAGGSLDLLGQLVTELPDADFLVSIERRHLEGFRTVLRSWPLGRDDRMTIAVEPLAVAQWAQDNGKAGVLEAPLENGGPPRLATLLPRYASRRDDGSVFVPGESFLADGLAAAGHVVLPSPLIFQGGNILAVRDPVTAERWLLVGESEVYRNTAMGLTIEQVREAFRVEFGVDRCEVLPSVSFHIDYDLCVRAHEGALVAFVNDRAAAVRLILAAGIDALERGGALAETGASAARDHLSQGRHLDLLNTLGPVLARAVDERGRYPISFADLFAVSETDSPIGNLQRLLVAMDVLAATAMPPEDEPMHPQVRAYLAALRRADAQRAALHARLRALGMRVEPVPSLSEAGRSLTGVNGIHDRTGYLMPAYGGLYANVDAAAAAAFERVLGPDIRVIPVLSGESQRRSGAVHCAVSAYPLLAP